MIAIGLRASPSQVAFAIVDRGANAVINIDWILIPKAFEMPEALKYVRGHILDILREYDVKRAGVRVTEPNSQRMSIDRIQLEGVILETFASSNLDQFFIGQISTIAGRLGIPRANIKPMLDRDEHPEIEGWGELHTHQREALLCALAC
jgi:hypothetical protein